MARALKVAVQMDPMDSVNIEGDSSFALMMTAQARGHFLWHYEVRHMSLGEGGGSGGRLSARARPVEVRRDRGNHYTFGAERTVDLSSLPRNQ